MVGWEERYQCVFVLLRDDFETERYRRGGSSVGGLHDFAPIVNFCKLIAIKGRVGARQCEQSPILIEYGSNSLPCVVEQALSFKEPAELFRPRIAGYLVGHLF